MPETADDATPRGREAVEHFRRVLRPVFEGRRFLVFGGPLAGLAKTARALRDLGAAGTFLLGDSAGTGDPPDPALGPAVSLGVAADSLMEGHRAGERALLAVPPAVREAVDRWDPEGSARAIGYFSLAQVPAIAGRRRFAFRPASWQALEDKTAVDAFFDAAGVARAPSEVVPAEAGALRAAARRLDRGGGTAWAGDAREGVNGGAEYLRVVRGPGDEGEALAFLRAHCDRVRVMPFLEGIPCSIHGVVLPDGRTSVFRPVEMVVLRRPGGNRLLYAGCGTYYDPAPADREALRAVGRRVGEALHRTLGYRGGFTVDGVFAAEGWRPTELNPRPGAGHNQLAASLPGLPFSLLLLAAQEGVLADGRPDLLEEAVVEAADRVRAGGTWCICGGRRERTEKGAFAGDPDGTLRPAREGETPAASWEAGPGASGPFVRITPAKGSLPAGPPLGPWAVRALAAADAHLGTGFGPLEAAGEARPGG
jgi:hypothetical protein